MQQQEDRPFGIASVALSPDMFPLVRQVQIASDQAKNGISRLAGVEPRAMRTTKRQSTS